jgi:prophage regulatory protein
MDQLVTARLLPETGYLRIRQVLGDRKRGILPLIPICRSAWYKGIREGRYPAGVLLAPKTRVWRAEDIRDLITSTSAELR